MSRTRKQALTSVVTHVAVAAALTLCLGILFSGIIR